MKIVRFVALATLVMSVWGCSNSGADSPTDTSGERRKALLQHSAEKIIYPAFEQANIQAVALQTAIGNALLSPTPQTIESARSAWKTTVMAWQRASLYNFGPGEDNLGAINEAIATFPVAPSDIESFIASADTTFQNFRRDTRGLFAIEYLLFNGSASDVANALAQSSLRKAYLRSVTRDITTRVNSAFTGWNTYKSSFIANDGSAAGSSLSELFNNFAISFEALKNFKIGVPAGMRAGQTSTEPTRVEAFYSGYSLTLAREHFEVLVQAWEGIANDGTDGTGYADYIQPLVGGNTLATETRTQITAVRNAFAALPPEANLAELLQTGTAPTNVVQLHTELQKLTRFFKSELSSVMGVSITYSSGDGD